MGAFADAIKRNDDHGEQNQQRVCASSLPHLLAFDPLLCSCIGLGPDMTDVHATVDALQKGLHGLWFAKVRNPL
jgi:hypothetical protein